MLRTIVLRQESFVELKARGDRILEQVGKSLRTIRDSQAQARAVRDSIRDDRRDRDDRKI